MKHLKMKHLKMEHLKDKSKNHSYSNFFGIDVAKDNFVTSVYGINKISEYSNDRKGFVEFYNDYKKLLQDSLVTLEVTGGYELNLCNFLLTKKLISIHRGQPRQIKNFIRSFGVIAKTDEIDSKSLSAYGKERHASLSLYKKMLARDEELLDLVKRKQDLVRSRAKEKNRLSSPSGKYAKPSIREMIKYLTGQIDKLEVKIKDLVSQDKELCAKKAVIEDISGIGDKTSINLLTILPELGSLGNKQVAALAGLAPHPHDSGKLSGYRKTGRGRIGIKEILMMSALSSSKSKGKLGDYYRGLIARGKKPMLAIVALMRKILVIANAKIRDHMAKVAQQENNNINVIV